VQQLALQHLAQVFGSLYVIEGSALGGQVIAPKLARELGLQPGGGASYFHGFGSDTGGMWRDFRTVLAREVEATDNAVQQACQAARDTFQALINVFRTVLT
jgi:heme oxygenase